MRDEAMLDPAPPSYPDLTHPPHSPTKNSLGLHPTAERSTSSFGSTHPIQPIHPGDEIRKYEFERRRKKIFRISASIAVFVVLIGGIIIIIGLTGSFNNPTSKDQYYNSLRITYTTSPFPSSKDSDASSPTIPVSSSPAVIAIPAQTSLAQPPAASTAILTSTQTATVSGTPVSEIGFSIKHVASGRCINPVNGSANPTNDDFAVLADNCGANSKFTFTAAGSLRHSSGKCLHPFRGSANPTDNTEIVFFDGCDEPRLQFTLAGAKLKHVMSGKCVHPLGGSPNPASGTHLHSPKQLLAKVPVFKQLSRSSSRASSFKERVAQHSQEILGSDTKNWHVKTKPRWFNKSQQSIEVVAERIAAISEFSEMEQAYNKELNGLKSHLSNILGAGEKTMPASDQITIVEFIQKLNEVIEVSDLACEISNKDNDEKSVSLCKTLDCSHIYSSYAASFPAVNSILSQSEELLEGDIKKSLTLLRKPIERSLWYRFYIRQISQLLSSTDSEQIKQIGFTLKKWTEFIKSSAMDGKFDDFENVCKFEDTMDTTKVKMSENNKDTKFVRTYLTRPNECFKNSKTLVLFSAASQINWNMTLQRKKKTHPRRQLVILRDSLLVLKEKANTKPGEQPFELMFPPFPLEEINANVYDGNTKFPNTVEIVNKKSRDLLLFQFGTTDARKTFHERFNKAKNELLQVMQVMQGKQELEFSPSHSTTSLSKEILPIESSSIVFDLPCRLYKLISNEWSDFGLCQFRLTRTNSHSILDVRMKGVHRVLLTVAIQHAKIVQENDKHIRIYSLFGKTNHLIKMKKPDLVQVMETLNELSKSQINGSQSVDEIEPCQEEEVAVAPAGTEESKDVEELKKGENNKMTGSPQQSILSVAEEGRGISQTDSAKTECARAPSFSEIIQLFEQKSNSSSTVRRNSITFDTESTTNDKDTIIQLRDQLMLAQKENAKLRDEIVKLKASNNVRLTRMDTFLEMQKEFEEERDLMKVENEKLKRQVEMLLAMVQKDQFAEGCKEI
ncbi:hypothetical protein HK098_000929 [Nowakowskiella sp. JEL0407]|nr:hypothetical protein HK098_000929 [Nowakowskiella sp. JEL0407]